jgi:hypothetical protein
VSACPVRRAVNATNNGHTACWTVQTVRRGHWIHSSAECQCGGITKRAFVEEPKITPFPSGNFRLADKPGITKKAVGQALSRRLKVRVQNVVKIDLTGCLHLRCRNRGSFLHRDPEVYYRAQLHRRGKCPSPGTQESLSGFAKERPQVSVLADLSPRQF